jgi:multicomponent Na+:H+ antiporter subunit D
MTLLLPLLIPLFTALLAGLLRQPIRTPIGLAGGALLLLTAGALLWRVASEGPQSLAVGGWPLPYAIEFYADGLSALLVLAVALIHLLILVYQIGWPESPSTRDGAPLQHALVAATLAVLLAADLFNLYVWFELMLITLLGLLVQDGGKRSLEAAFKYFALSMLGTLLMLASIGLIHGASGQLNFAALAAATGNPDVAAMLPLYAGLLLIAVFLKAGVFPLYAWLPAAYHTLPAPLLALVGGLLTKISIYVLLRVTGQVFDVGQVYEALGWLALVTMVSGVLGAAFHWDLRRILAFHIVSQIGYLLLGLALASPASATATGVFLFHNMLVKTNLLLIAGLMWLGMGHYDLRLGGGLFPARPLLAVLFLLNALALVGVPPSSGFWGKYLLLLEAFEQERFLWGAVALGTGLLTLYSMSKIWLEGFWKPGPASARTAPLPRPALAAVTLLSLPVLALGLYPEPLVQFLQSQSAAFWR